MEFPDLSRASPRPAKTLKGVHLSATKIDAQHRAIRLIDGVQREHCFGRVDANALDLGHGRLLYWSMTSPSLALDAVGPSTPTEKLPLTTTSAMQGKDRRTRLAASYLDLRARCSVERTS